MLAISLIILLALVASSVFVAAVLGLLGAGLSQLYSPFPLLRATGEIAWSTSTDFVLVAVPMFILMGELLLRSGVTEAMYSALDKWVGHVPGGLMHTNVAASAIFAATSGSSVATAATIGTVASPNIDRYGYRPRLFLGTIAAGGTLGILIPPSINMVLYGSLSETSVSKLYLAAMIPGAIVALLFSLLILALCILFPHLSPRHPAHAWALRMRELIHLLPMLVLFLLVVGSIYAGVATPTEASALGVMGAFALVALRRQLSVQLLLRAFEGTVRTTSMIMLIVIAAFFLNFVMSTIGLTDKAVEIVAGLTWDPLTIMLALILLYLVLGCFVETLTLMVATTPLVVPIILQLGYDPVWFGVVFVLLIEAALITPPVGMNLFVVQSVTGYSFRDVALGALPFFCMLLMMIGLLLAFPQLALWLPSLFDVRPGA